VETSYTEARIKETCYTSYKKGRLTEWVTQYVGTAFEKVKERKQGREAEDDDVSSYYMTLRT
jgi:hypothetical protein